MSDKLRTTISRANAALRQWENTGRCSDAEELAPVVLSPPTGVLDGDMTPGAKRMLERILDGEL